MTLSQHIRLIRRLILGARFIHTLFNIRQLFLFQHRRIILFILHRMLMRQHDRFLYRCTTRIPLDTPHRPGRSPRPHRSRRNFRPRRHNRTRFHHRSRSHHGPIQYLRHGTHLGSILERRGVNQGARADADGVPNRSGGIALNLGHVNDGAVANAGLGANGDGIHVAADNGAVPDTGWLCECTTPYDTNQPLLYISIRLTSTLSQSSHFQSPTPTALQNIGPKPWGHRHPRPLQTGYWGRAFRCILSLRGFFPCCRGIFCVEKNEESGNRSRQIIHPPHAPSQRQWSTTQKYVPDRTHDAGKSQGRPSYNRSHLLFSICMYVFFLEQQGQARRRDRVARCAVFGVVTR